MWTNAGKKLSSQLGETIGETLVSLLISALALTMLAGAITASGNVVMSGRRKLDAYYSDRTLVTLMQSVGFYTTDPLVPGEDFSMTISGTPGDGTTVADKVKVEFYISEVGFGDTQISAYKIDTRS